MNLPVNKLREIKDELRDLTTKELAIESRRKQLFMLLAASYCDDRMACRVFRILFYELEKERIYKLRDENLEFLNEDINEEESGHNEVIT